jgi:tellurite resistance protein
LRLEARLEIARTYLDYACMLAARDGKSDRPHASALVDQARVLLTALGVRPLVRRAAELTQVLNAG